MAESRFCSLLESELVSYQTKAMSISPPGSKNVPCDTNDCPIDVHEAQDEALSTPIPVNIEDLVEELRQVLQRSTVSVDNSNPIINRALLLTDKLAEKVKPCPICYQIMTDPLTTTCQHAFCKTCLRTWLKHSYSCPTCRKVVSLQPEQIETTLSDNSQRSEHALSALNVLENLPPSAPPLPSSCGSQPSTNERPPKPLISEPTRQALRGLYSNVNSDLRHVILRAVHDSGDIEESDVARSIKNTAELHINALMDNSLRLQIGFGDCAELMELIEKDYMALAWMRLQLAYTGRIEVISEPERKSG